MEYIKGPVQYLLTVETSEDVPIPILVLEAFLAAFLVTINWNQDLYNS